MTNLAYPEQKKIKLLRPDTLWSYESLFRKQDVQSVRDVVAYLDANQLQAYLFGSVLNNADESYFDIDMAGVGARARAFAVARNLSRGIVRMGRHSYFVEECDENYPELHAETRVTVFPMQNFFSRLFRRKASIDLSILTEENFERMQREKLRFY